MDDILRTARRQHRHPLRWLHRLHRKRSFADLKIPLLVIDGQQRPLPSRCFLKRCAIPEGEEPRRLHCQKSPQLLLQNPLEDGDRAYKLLLPNHRETLLSLVDQKPLPANESIRIRENFELLSKPIAQGDLGNAKASQSS